jgi:ferredoxin-NADP reductase
LRDEAGRGGSKALQDSLRVQDKVRISYPRNNFELAAGAKRAILLAGGIGVTPLKAMAHRLEEVGVDYEMHYCAKDESCTAFAAELAPMHAGGKLKFHFDNGDPSKGLDLKRLLSETAPGVHVYYCGPGGFMKACAAATEHWAAGTVHFEHFKAPERAASDDVAATVGEFIVKIASTGQSIAVSSDRSIADALEEAGVAIETSCRAGLCGTCKVRYLSGDVEHNDCILADNEKQEYLTTCVSRALSRELVLDL